MQRDTGVAHDVEVMLESMEDSQRQIADQWTEVMRTAARPKQKETDAILRSQNEIARIALRWMDPGSAFAALASNWLTLPRSVAATTLELQRKTLEAWTTREELRLEAIAQRWSGPWLDATRAFQEAAARMVEIQSAWVRSLVSQSGDERTEPARPRASSAGRRARSPSRQSRRASGNGRRSAPAQRAH